MSGVDRFAELVGGSSGSSSSGSDIEAGRLVELLADHAPPATPIQMLFPPSRAQPRRVRALAEQLALRLQGAGAS